MTILLLLYWLFVFFGTASLYFFPEFLFPRQWLFGCKVTKFPTKAFIARQKMLSGVKVWTNVQGFCNISGGTTEKTTHSVGFHRGDGFGEGGQPHHHHPARLWPDESSRYSPGGKAVRVFKCYRRRTIIKTKNRICRDWLLQLESSRSWRVHGRERQSFSLYSRPFTKRDS